MWERAVQDLPTRVVDDQYGRPTYTVDLAEATWKLIRAESTGTAQAGAAASDAAGNRIIHVANNGQATWYDVAKQVFAKAGGSELLSPCSTADYPTPARRPKRSVLDTALYERLTGGALPHWQDTVDRFLEIVRTESPTTGS
jgi:dTDP-4-dehydrorhamnose reductase